MQKGELVEFWEFSPIQVTMIQCQLVLFGFAHRIRIDHFLAGNHSDYDKELL